MTGAEQGVVLSMLLIFTLPSLVHFVLGPAEGMDPPGEHMFRFFGLGVLLFIPVMFVLFGVSFTAYEHGIEFLSYHDSSCANLSADGCTIGAEALLGIIAIGVLVYWLTYVAGVNMREVWTA